jgi:hypothetical protein
MREVKIKLTDEQKKEYGKLFNQIMNVDNETKDKK